MNIDDPIGRTLGLDPIDIIFDINDYNHSFTPNSSRFNSFYGKKHTEETKKYLSILKKKQYIGHNNPFYGKKHTEETKKIMSEKKIGKKRSENAKQKISQGKLGKKRAYVVCPHCMKQGREGGMFVWHFDNCKKKETD